MKQILFTLTTIILMSFAALDCASLNIVYAGDSIIADYPAYAVWFPNGGETPATKTSKLLRATGYAVTDTNIAVSGSNVYSVYGLMPTANRYLKTGATNILVFDGFHNAAGASNIRGELIAKTTFETVTLAKKQGFDKVFVFTAHCTNFISDSYPYYAYDSINPKRVIYNRLIIDSAAVYGYNVIDVGNDPRFNSLKATENTMFYRGGGDGLHLNGFTGAAAYAEIMAKTVDKALCNKLVTPTKVNDPDNSGYSIYPNPCTGEITVTGGGYGKYEIVTANGRVAAAGNNTGIIHVPNNFTKGIYFLKIYALDNTIVFCKFVLQ